MFVDADAVNVVISTVPAMSNLEPDALINSPLPVNDVAAVTILLLVNTPLPPTLNMVEAVIVPEFDTAAPMRIFGISLVVVPLITVPAPSNECSPAPAVNEVALLVKFPPKLVVISAVSFHVPFIVTLPVNVFNGLVEELKIICPPESTVVFPVTVNVYAGIVSLLPVAIVTFPAILVMFAPVVTFAVPESAKFPASEVTDAGSAMVFTPDPLKPRFQYGLVAGSSTV